RCSTATFRVRRGSKCADSVEKADNFLMRSGAQFRVGLLICAIAFSVSLSAQRTTKPKPTNPPAAAEPSGKPCPFERPDDEHHRIILTDGNYQVSSKCQIIGDRVHYMSAERSEWEDIPTSLVDWEATKKYELGQSEPK